MAAIRLTVDVPALLSPAQRVALQRVLDRCTVHHSIRRALEVRIDLDVLVLGGVKVPLVGRER